MEIKEYSNINDECKYIRITVFVEEQGFIDEFDEIDNNCYHLVCYVNGLAIGCLRYFLDNEGYHIGRLAVLKEYRKKGIGKALIDYSINQIRSISNNPIILHSQIQVKGFYEKCGFKSVGDVYLEEDYPHITMIYND